MEVVEDIGLARRVKRAGLAQRVAFGEGLVRVHWAAGVPGLATGTSICAIVRPESVSVAPPSGDRAGARARVVDMAYLGHQISCELECDNGVGLTMSVHHLQQPVEVGSHYEVSWPLSSVWLLPRDDAGAQAAA